MNRTFLIITGMPSSSLSIICESLKIINVASIAPPSKADIPTPYYIHRLLLRDLNYSKNTIGSLPKDWIRSSSAGHARKRIEKLLSPIKNSSKLYFASDPLFFRFIPLWNEIFNNAGMILKFIFMIRHPWETAQSLVKLDPDSAHLWWLFHTRETLRLIGEQPKAIVTFEQLISDPVSTLISIGRKLDLDWPKDPILAARTLLDYVQLSDNKMYTSNFSEIDKPKFHVYSRIYRDIVAGKWEGLSDYIDTLCKETENVIKSNQVKLCQKTDAPDLIDSMFEALDRFENIDQYQSDALRNVNTDSSLFTCVVIPSPSEKSEISEIVYLVSDNWQLVKLDIPDASLLVDNALSIQPLNTNGMVTISNISFVNSTNEEIIYCLKASRQFDQLTLNGSVVRFVDEKSLKLIVTGDDSSISLMLPKETIKEVPMRFEMWIKASRHQEIIRDNRQLANVNYKATVNYSPQYPIILCTHHKAGTSFLIRTFRHLQEVLNKKIWYKFYDPELPPDDWAVCIHQHSRINELISRINFRGWHCIRHPKSLIYSAVLYHQKCDEAWAHIPLEGFSSDTFLVCTDGGYNNKIKDPDYPEPEKRLLMNSKMALKLPPGFKAYPSSYKMRGKTYQEFIKSLPTLEEKIIFEMRSYSRGVINDMMNFPNDNRFFTIKIEDISKDPTMYALREGFLHLGFGGSELDKCLKITEKYCLWNNEVNKMKHVTTGVSDAWKEVFTGKVEEEFRNLFGYAEEALGYFDKKNHRKVFACFAM